MELKKTDFLYYCITKFDAIHYMWVVLIGGAVALWVELPQLLLPVFFFAVLNKCLCAKR